MTERVNDHLARLSRLALVALVIFLLASLLASVEKNLDLQRENRKTLATLTKTNDGIVAKLTDVFEAAQQAEDAAKAAGTVPPQTVASIVESLKGYIDPALIAKAVQAAQAAVAGQVGPKGATGATGARGPVGPAGTTATTAPATTTTVPAGATTTTRPARSSTTTSSTTTTSCAVNLPGLRLLC